MQVLRRPCATLMVASLLQRAPVASAVQHRMHDFGIAARAARAESMASAVKADIEDDSGPSCLLQVESTVRRGAAAAAKADVAVAPNKAALLAKEVEAVLQKSQPQEAAPATEEAAPAREQEESSGKHYSTLLLIELFPFVAMFGVDRFYLGQVGLGIAKFLVCTCTLGLGGLVWGAVDFLAITINALKGNANLHAAGMHADFDATEGSSDRNFKIAVLDLVMVPAWAALAWAIWAYRKKQRLEALRQAAMKSSHYGSAAGSAPSAATATHGG